MGVTYFKDKICTILTCPTNRQFSEEQNLQYFVGKLVGIDAEAVEIENLDKTRTLFFREKVIGIAEEKSEESYVLEEQEEKQKPQEEESPYINLDLVKKMALKAKESFHASN